MCETVAAATEAWTIADETFVPPSPNRTLADARRTPNYSESGKKKGKREKKKRHGIGYI